MRRGRILAFVIAAVLSLGATGIGSVASAGASTGPSGSRSSVHPSTTAGSTLGAAWSRSSEVETVTPAAVAVPPGSPIPTMTVPDFVGDAVDPSGQHYVPQGDLTGAGILQNSHGTTFGVTVVDPRNPNVDARWLNDGVAIVWYVDTNRDNVPDHAAIMTSDAKGNVIAEVGTLNAPTCYATSVYIVGVGYRIIAAAGCLPKMTSVRFAACMSSGGDSTDPDTSTDCAPDGGLGPVTVVSETTSTTPPPTKQARPASGYWMLGADGHVFAFGGAVGFAGRVAGATAITPRRNGTGYWIVDLTGHVFAYGSAQFFGGTPALAAGEFVSTISATPGGDGYWLFTNRGRAFPFGSAKSYGDMAGRQLNGPIVASVATPTGSGYYMVGSDGGIFSFGDARFHGSTGNLRLNEPVVGISPTADGNGYWLVASDGGVFAFSAPFRGSMGGTRLTKPVDGLVAFGNGYLMAAADGGVFDFSNQAFDGSLAGTPLAAPIIGLAAFAA